MSYSDLIVDSTQLRQSVSGLFVALGLPAAAADIVADGLVEADEEGISSHGIMLLPMYVDRIQAGSVSLETEAAVVNDTAAMAVLDARNMLGQLSARQSTGLAVQKSKEFGLGCVTVRNGFHFGTAGRHALEIAQSGCIGIVMCNTRPLLPAPGGAKALVGNNPIAIAVPSPDGGQPVVADMALSASAMGKIRLAEAAGEDIPDGWATDSQGIPTNDPTAAINGMLLPAAGPKGFGLAFMIELMCGGLSSGAMSEEVRPLYGDATEPYGCAHFFMAIDVAHFRDLSEFKETVQSMVQRVSTSPTAPGMEKVMSPGEPAWRTKMSRPGKCSVSISAHEYLINLSEELGLESDDLRATTS